MSDAFFGEYNESFGDFVETDTDFIVEKIEIAKGSDVDSEIIEVFANDMPFGEKTLCFTGFVVSKMVVGDENMIEGGDGSDAESIASEAVEAIVADVV